MRERLQTFFTQSTRHRPYGVFDGENSFVVRPRKRGLYAVLGPLIEGHLSANEGGGCDVVLRASHRRVWWILDVLLLGALFVQAFASRDKTADLVLLLSCVAILVAVTFLALPLRGGAFARRIKRLLATAG